MLGLITFRMIHDSDTAFLKKLYGDCRAQEFEAIAWSDRDRENFIALQFEAQDKSYKTTFVEAAHRIIQLDGADIGRLIINRTDQSFHIIDLSILSIYRGRGIGGDILKSIINEARVGSVPVSLSVIQNNPAISLYHRLGFQQTGVSGLYISMQWSPI